ncbi:MAG: penicillin-binding protein [Oscillospiraceae bacterium]|nr:penicillin-binding protein [Oscillospiraceae bacterium]
MNRVTRRASAVLFLVIALVGGLFFFVYEYFTKADQWIVSPGSPHIYNSSNIGCGRVYDRSGTLLLDITEARTYASSESVRLSTLHWLGDRNGSISAPAIAYYAKEMTGYNIIDGLYSYSGEAGAAVLTLSSEVQSAALKAMAGRKGTVAVYNYQTGEILCAVTTPTYDPDNVPGIDGDTSGAYEGIYLNRFTQSAYVPGSIFKVVTTAAALDCVDGILDKTFTCTGLYEYGIDKVTCERAHGKLDLKGALARSCNCSFAQIAALVGKDNMEKYVEKFEVIKPLKFDGVTTASGNYDLSRAAPVEVAWSAIGQYTDQINPCRYMSFMGAVAGGGKAAQPYLVSHVTAEGEITYEAETVLSDRLMSEDVAATLQSYLRNNVVSIYGADKFPAGLTVCGKSGTSQLGGDQEPNAMFTGFVLDDKYPLAFICVVENGGYGSSTCVPVLSKVLSACKEVIDRG